MSDEIRNSRRRFLQWAGVVAAGGVAGCGGDGDEDTPTATATPAEDAVPAEYETATSLNGRERDPDALSSKEAVNYQAEPNEGEQCSGCAFYIPDKNDDGLGACSIVAGTIDPEAWCTSYSAYQTDTEG